MKDAWGGEGIQQKGKGMKRDEVILKWTTDFKWAT
jgi:hypothetical protein